MEAAGRAGMVLLGHLHTHEFAAGGTTDQVGNPWDLERSAGGSSGGSAAALAAFMVPAATGTDTAGSLRIPSACCGTSAIKPTRGRVSMAGVVPLAWSLDHAGPMARTLADCRLLLAAMTGPDRGRAESALDASCTCDLLADRESPEIGLPACGSGFLRARRERSSTPTWRRASSSRSRRAVASVQCSSSRRLPRADRRRATTSSTS